MKFITYLSVASVASLEMNTSTGRGTDFLQASTPIGRDLDCKNETHNCEYTMKCDGPMEEIGNPSNK